ncbi:MAG: CPBP family intramembrane metalloprotease [Anaerolineae bacterium]|nr:CPBP family intramembrane metalloprotease [Anaerolineae bacterium]
MVDRNSEGELEDDMSDQVQMKDSNIITDKIVLPTKRPFSWKVFLVVLVGTAIGIVAVIPYMLTMQSETLKTANLGMPLWMLLVIQVLQSTAFYGVLAAIGLLLAHRIGLGLPFIEGWLKKEPIWNRFPRVLLVSVIVGLVGGAIIVGLDAWIFGPPMQTMLQDLNIVLSENIQPPAWQGFLASFEGGITEEVLLRLFMLTLLAWLGSLVSHDAEGRPSLVVLWLANILAAVLFGLGHLPATAAVGLPLNALVITRAIVLNGVLGLACGWLYWTRGLESAMIAHFCADIVLHVIVAAL